MEIAEIKRQRIIAGVELDKLKQLYGRGSSTAEEIQKQQDIYDQIRAYELQVTTPFGFQDAKMVVAVIDQHTDIRQAPIQEGELKPPTETRLAEIPVQFTDEQKSVLNSLKSELDAIDLAKNRLINNMALIPKEQNALAEVQAIKAMRELWMQKGDEIYYFQRHGTLPAAPVEKDNLTDYEKELPRDKYELEKLRRNLLPNLSKYKKALQAAKTEAKKAHYNTMIMQANMKLVAIENLMSVNLNPTPAQ